VRALMRGRDRPPAPGVSETVAGDLADANALSRLVAGADIVIHNAGLVRARTRAAFFEVNLDGARRMAATAAATTDAPAFLLVSSLAAKRPTVSAYAASKAEAEQAARQALAGRRFAILRPPAIYGPFDDATRPLFQAMRRGLIPRLGPKGVRVAMIHVDDAARAAIAAAENATTDGPVFEIDDGAGGHSWADIRTAAAAATGRRIVQPPVPAWLLKSLGAWGDAAARLGIATPFLTSGKAREIMAGDWIADPAAAPPNWSPEVSLASGFRQTLACYRERGQ